MLETHPHGLAVVEQDGTVALANRSARALLGAARGDDRRLGELPGWLGPALATVMDGPAREARSERRTRLVGADGAAVRVVLTAAGREATVLTLRWESPREHELHAVLVTQLGLDASEAQLACRMLRGDLAASIARSFGVSVGAVRTRLMRLYRRLGVRRRAGAVALISSLAAQLPAGPRPSLARDPESVPDRGLGFPLDPWWAALEGAVASSGAGLVATDPTGRIAGASPALRALCGDAHEDLLAALPDIVAPGDGPQLVAAAGAPWRMLWWDAGRGLRGLQLTRERRRGADVATLLCERFGLTARQAEIAVLVGRGGSNQAVAAALGISAGTVSATTTTLYARLGATNRAGLAALVAEIAGGVSLDQDSAADPEAP
ncbi:MAG TPA: LuxR C-terminal-related transcriptional regulator [Polyangia bacterium]